FPCQVLQRQLAPFPAQPFGPGLFLRDAALLVAYLEQPNYASRAVPREKQAPAQPRMKWQQTLTRMPDNRAIASERFQTGKPPMPLPPEPVDSRVCPVKMTAGALSRFRTDL